MPLDRTGTLPEVVGVYSVARPETRGMVVAPRRIHRAQPGHRCDFEAM